MQRRPYFTAPRWILLTALLFLLVLYLVLRIDPAQHDFKNAVLVFADMG